MLKLLKNVLAIQKIKSTNFYSCLPPNFPLGSYHTPKAEGNYSFSHGQHFLNFCSLKKLWPLLMDVLQLLQGHRATTRRQFTFCHYIPRNSWYSFNRPQKDERLSRPWSHQEVLNTGPLHQKSSALTTRPLLQIPPAKRGGRKICEYFICAQIWCSELQTWFM